VTPPRRRPRPAAQDWLVVGLAFALLAGAAVAWLAVDRRPPEWDHANHLERAVLCARDLAAGRLDAIVDRSSFYPPLVPCAGALAYRLAPSDALSAQLAVLVFLGVGMAATYLLGRRLAGPDAGLAAALLFGSAPFVVFLALRFQLDLPLAAMVALALLVLLHTEGFTRRGWCLVAGVVFGLGLLTKPTFPVYVLPPALLMAARIRTRGAALGAALAVAVAAVLSAPWYGPRLVGLPMQLASRSFKQAAEAGHPDPATWTGLLIYPRWFFDQFGVLAAVLFGLGLVVAAWRRAWIPLVATVVPFAILELMQNKNLRYTLPLLPAVAVVAAMALTALPRRLRTAAALALVATGILQTSGTMLGWPPGVVLPVVGVPWVLASPPIREDWRQREILAAIERHRRGAPATVSVVPNFDLFSVSNFRYYALRDGLDLRFVRAWDDAPLGVEYMILKSGHVGPEWTADKPRRIDERFARDPHLGRVFPVIGEYPLPDGSMATLRAREIPAVADVSPSALAEAIEEAVKARVAEFARDVEGLRVRLDYDASVDRGRLRRLEIEAASAVVGELSRRRSATLRVRDLRITVDDVLVNPHRARHERALEVLDAGRVRFERAAITGDDLRQFVRANRRFREATVELAGGLARFALPQPGPDVSARVRILPSADRPFALAATDVRLGGVPVPGAVVDWVLRHYDPTPRLAARLPVPVELGAVSIDGDAVRITPRVGEEGGR
jgi:hypothetical protein